MKKKMQGFLRRGASFLTPSSPSSDTDTGIGSSLDAPTLKFTSVKEDDGLFPKVDPAVDGEDCDHDCASCTIRYPAKFDIEMDDKLYGKVKPWSTQLLVATGKTDWVRDVEDEKGSVMEAIEKGGLVPNNGVCAIQSVGCVYICMKLMTAANHRAIYAET